MKKILLFTVAATAALTFASCSQSSDLADTTNTNSETATQAPIGFDTYLSKTTRAGAVGAQNTETLKTNGFGVFAYYTGSANYNNSTTPNFMYNTKVSVPTGSTAFTYSPVRYWPNNDGDKLSFFAYAPYIDVDPTNGTAKDQTTTGITALSNNTYKSAPTVTYELAEDMTKSVDLLWGTKMGTTNGVNTDLTRTTANVKSVGFTFKHALAKFGDDINSIQAVLMPEDNVPYDEKTTKVTISSITISSKENNNIVKSGIFDLEKGTWSPSTKDYMKNALNITIDNIKEEYKDNDVEIETKESAKKFLETTGVPTGTPVSILNASMDPYYFIPGTQPTLTVKVTYWVRTLDESLPTGITNVKQTITSDLKFPVFLINKKYNLVLKIGLNSIKFDAKVDSWTETDQTSTQEVEVPSVVVKS